MSDEEYDDPHEYINPRLNKLIPQDDDDSARPTPTADELQKALDKFGPDSSLDLVPGVGAGDKLGVEIMPGLRLERAGGRAGLHPFKNGVIIRDLETLSEDERRAILDFLND